MFKEENVAYLKYLYRNIFGKDANNSKEFITFVQNGDPHPLRIKLEEINQEIHDNIVEQSNVMDLLDKMSFITELDAIIMNYIEENYV